MKVTSIIFKVMSNLDDNDNNNNDNDNDKDNNNHNIDLKRTQN